MRLFKGWLWAVRSIIAHRRAVRQTDNILRQEVSLLAIINDEGDIEFTIE